MRFLKNRTVLGVLCIVLSLIICFAVTPLVSFEGMTAQCIFRCWLMILSRSNCRD